MAPRSSTLLLPLALLLSTLVAGACSTFGSDGPQDPGVTPDGGTSTDPDGSPVVTGTPDRGITITVGDPKATNFVMQAGSLDLPVKLTRRPSSTGPVLVTVTNLPADVTADPVTIPTGKSEGTITLKAKATSVQGGPKIADVTATEQGPQGTGANSKLTAFVRGGRGALDTTFGDKGVIKNLYNGGEAQAQDAKILRDGKILVCSRAANRLVISRFTSDGMLDAAFSGGGISVLETGQGTVACDLFEPPAPAKAFIYGLKTLPSTNVIYRLNSDGTRDTGFNTTGQVNVDDGVGGVAARQAIQILALDDGRALVSNFRIAADADTTITRWNTDGTRDDTYGTNSSCKIAGGGRMVLRPGGAIYMVGTAGMQGCTAAGAPDATIGAAPDHAIEVGGSVVDIALVPGGGVAFLHSYTATPFVIWNRLTPALVTDAGIGLLGNVGAGFKSSQTFVLQPDGGVLVGSELDASFQVTRFAKNGALDTAFGTGGTASFTISDVAKLSRLAAQPDGRILAVGRSDGASFDAGMVRFWP